MNSVTPAATGREDAGFRDSKAGGKNIARKALRRSPQWLVAPLLVLICGSAHPAHANGVNTTIGNGQTVTGSLSGDGSDSYSFKAPGGGSFEVSVSETGFHDPSFSPTITLT